MVENGRFQTGSQSDMLCAGEEVLQDFCEKVLSGYDYLARQEEKSKVAKWILEQLPDFIGIQEERGANGVEYYLRIPKVSFEALRKVEINLKDEKHRRLIFGTPRFIEDANEHVVFSKLTFLIEAYYREIFQGLTDLSGLWIEYEKDVKNEDGDGNVWSTTHTHTLYYCINIPSQISKAFPCVWIRLQKFEGPISED